MRFVALLAVLATLAPPAADGSVESASAPSARGPIISERAARTGPVLNPRAANSPLVIELGPLPADARDANIPKRVHKRRRVGVHRPLPEAFGGDLVPRLEWVAGAAGGQVAAIEVRAQGAVSLRIAVRAVLPPGASVQVFDANGQPHGSRFTPEHFEADAPVWLPSVEGDTLTVQIAVPSTASIEAVSFTVATVSHRFARLIPRAVPQCFGHVDVPCVSDSIRRDTADGVGRVVFEDVGGTFTCTGTLLNVGDTPDLYEPYLLTANHCVATDAVAATVEVAWFWQRADCNGSDIDPRLTYSFAGAALLATSPSEDATLLRLRENLPGGLLYLGWSTEEVRVGTSVFSVHHPNGFAAQYSEGRVRRIVDADVDGNLVNDTIETAWSRGLTEGGSSGAGLFTGLQRLVGVLAGGELGCATAGDVFGPFRAFFPYVARWLKPSDHAPETFAHMLPAVPGADAGAVQGFIRIMNNSSRAGEVEIHAVDDTGQRRGPVTLRLDARQVRHFNSDDLERGSASKGLLGGVGDGTGMWRLELETELDIEPLAYIRTPDGFVTSMHQLALATAGDELTYRVPFFNPGSNTAIRSLLRVINPNASEVSVTIDGWDDDRVPGEQTVRLSLAAGRAIQMSAQALEAGDPAFEGRLGDGAGKWELAVTGSRPLHVMSLLATQSGHLTNLSQ